MTLSTTAHQGRRGNFEVNVLSGVRLSRFYLPPMLRENWGRIVFIVAYVCSPRASATNGAALRVEDGVVRSIV